MGAVDDKAGAGLDSIEAAQEVAKDQCDKPHKYRSLYVAARVRAKRQRHELRRLNKLVRLMRDARAGVSKMPDDPTLAQETAWRPEQR